MSGVRRVCTVALLLAGCGAAPAAPGVELRPVADVRGVMIGLVEPAAAAVWESVSTTITREGRVDRQPRTDAEWGELRLNAMVLIESGNLLLMEGRGPTSEAWSALTGNLIDAAFAVLAAIDARDAPGVLDVGGRLYESCETCHASVVGLP